MVRPVAVIPQLSWPREWCTSATEGRLQLATTLDALLPQIESDGAFVQFLLDGQMHLVDEYLHTRPTATPTVRSLATSGRLALGPWYVAPDEFLSSPETVVRNLQAGLARAADLGHPLDVCILFDSWGHLAQLPQLLRSAGLYHALVVSPTPQPLGARWWRAPDGSTVRAEYVGQAPASETDVSPEQLVAALARYEEQLTTAGGDGPLLWLQPSPATANESVPDLLAGANAYQCRYSFRLSSLADYLHHSDGAAITAVSGELPGDQRPGALSGDLMRRAHASVAEIALERLAEPLAALWLPDPAAAHEALTRAAHQLIVGSAGSDGAAPGAGAPAYRHAAVLATAVTAQSLAAAGEAVAQPGPLVLNPSARDLAGLVELSVTAGPGAPPIVGTQTVHQGPTQRRVLLHSGPVAGFGWRTWQPGPLEVGEVRVGSNWLDNDLVHVAVDPVDGTFAVNGRAGMGRLVESGDVGDRRHYRASEPDRVIDRPERVELRVLEHGPLRGRLEVRRHFLWPAAALGDGGRGEAVPVVVCSILEVRAGEPLTRVTTSFDDVCQAHRLRVELPLLTRAEVSVAESALATVTRPYQSGAVLPSYRFVAAGGVVVIHDSLPEYELLDGGWRLALTVIRTPGPSAGPPAWDDVTRTPNPDCALGGRRTFRFAVALGEPNHGPAGGLDPYGLADLALVPLQVTPSTGRGPLPGAGQHLHVRGAEVSSLRRRGDELELRVFNPSSAPTVVELPERRGWLVDLHDELVGHWDGGFPLGPWGIATVRITTETTADEEGVGPDG